MNKKILLIIVGISTLALYAAYIFGKLELEVAILAITSIGGAVFSLFKDKENSDLKTELMSMEEYIMKSKSQHKNK